MKNRLLPALLPALLFSTGFAAADDFGSLTPIPSDRALPAAAIPDHFMVELRAGVNPRQFAPAFGIAPIYIYSRVINGFAGMVPPGRLAALAADPRVVRVVPDRWVAATAKPVKGGGGGTSTQTTPQGVQRIGAAPNTLNFTGTGVGVAVVDTGLDFNHADLIVSSESFTAFSGTAQDDNGHGTHVGGTVAAINNSTDVVGVAPGATLYAVKVLDARGSGSDSSVTAGLDWVAIRAATVTPRIRVVNMSLGRSGSVDDNLIQRAAVKKLTDSGIAVVVAAGNDASLEVSEQVPSAYPEVIAVASTTAANGTSRYSSFPGFIAADTASYFTSDGRFDPVTGRGVSISAPGEDRENITRAGFIDSIGILSTRAGGGTTRMSGTSMASPHVAGVAALLWEQALGKPVDLTKTLTPEDIRLKIRNSASNPSTAPLDSPTSGYTFDGEREGVVYAPDALSPTE